MRHEPFKHGHIDEFSLRCILCFSYPSQLFLVLIDTQMSQTFDMH